jgi:hypothetical protein
MLRFLKRIITNVGDSISCLLMTCFLAIATILGGLVASIICLTDFSAIAPYPRFKRAMVEA